MTPEERAYAEGFRAGKKEHDETMQGGKVLCPDCEALCVVGPGLDGKLHMKHPVYACPKEIWEQAQSEFITLLSRLEAAEAVCRELEKLTIFSGPKPIAWDWVDKYYRTWRKVAGK